MLFDCRDLIQTSLVSSRSSWELGHKMRIRLIRSACSLQGTREEKRQRELQLQREKNHKRKVSANQSSSKKTRRDSTDVAGGEDGASEDGSGQELEDGGSDVDAAMPAWVVERIEEAEMQRKKAGAKAKPKAKAAAPRQKPLSFAKARAATAAFAAAKAAASEGPPEPASSSAASAPSARSGTAPPAAVAPAKTAAPAEAEAEGPEPRAKASRKRTGTEQVLSLGAAGEIHYYPNDKNFVAFCRAAGHKECRRMRTAKASGPERLGRSGQGRPLGSLACWLYQGHTTDSKEAHGKLLRFPLAERVRARSKLMDLPGALEFTLFERPQREGEAEEPDLHP